MSHYNGALVDELRISCFEIYQGWPVHLEKPTVGSLVGMDICKQNI